MSNQSLVPDNVTVYDPHPGLEGCTEPMPEALRVAANEIRGQRLPLSQVIDRLQDAVDDGAFSVEMDYVGYGRGKQIYVPCRAPGLLVWQFNWRVVRIER